MTEKQSRNNIFCTDNGFILYIVFKPVTMNVLFPGILKLLLFCTHPYGKRKRKNCLLFEAKKKRRDNIFIKKKV